MWTTPARSTSTFLNHEAKSDMEAVYQECRDELAEGYDIAVLNQTAFNNTYTLAVTGETAAKATV